MMNAPRTSDSNPWGTWTFLDDDSVTLLGQFPHELVGTEVFEIFHPQDLNIFMESFESLVLDKSSPNKSYRIRTRNGDYVTITSTWSSFLNPWTRQLEFIQGNHVLVKGPKQPDIFSDTLQEQEGELSEDIVNPESNHWWYQTNFEQLCSKKAYSQCNKGWNNNREEEADQIYGKFTSRSS